jgi:hypothetical protein
MLYKKNVIKKEAIDKMVLDYHERRKFKGKISKNSLYNKSERKG